MRCAYLTMDDLGDFVSDASLSFAPMAARGWKVDMVSWRNPEVCWDDYDAVYICTPWDYPDDPEAFFGVLEKIDGSAAELVNDLALVRWTLSKRYLLDLEARGAPIVPSLLYEDVEALDMDDAFRRLDAEKLVIKPAIGGNALDTYVLDKPVAPEIRDRLQRRFAGRAFLVQRYIESIVDEGEYSLFFFAGRYSHAIRKVPRAGDFRVQEEHGAEISSLTPSPALIAAGDGIMALVDPAPVYARADFVRNADGRYLLMELEVIEPALYFRTDSGAPDRFAAALDAHVRARRTRR